MIECIYRFVVKFSYLVPIRKRYIFYLELIVHVRSRKISIRSTVKIGDMLVQLSGSLKI